MKKNLALIACTAVLAVGTTLIAAQPKNVEVEVLAAPAVAPEPPEQPEPPEPPEPPQIPQFVDRLQSIISIPAGARTEGRALIIPKEADDPKEFAETEEDLNVMARILEKAARGRDDKHPHAMGIPLQTGVYGSSSALKNLYIEGHGALFFLNVNFPLLAPATKSSAADDKEKTSTEWDEARRELYQKPGSGFEFNWKPAVAGGPAEEYDADKVEDLKRDVTAALKNASHIRKLKPDETVTVVISGRSASGETRIVRTGGGGGGGGTAASGETKTLKRSSGGGGFGGSSSGGSASGFRTVATARIGGGGESHGTKLIIRARKADIESFQKDKVGLDDFRKKVTMIVY